MANHPPANHAHAILKCSCGNLIAQCRCMAHDKAVRVVEHGCVNCKEILRQQPHLAHAKQPVKQDESIC